MSVSKIGQRESDLETRSVVFQAAIFIRVCADDFAGADHLRIDQPDRIEVQIVDLLELDNGADNILRAGLDEYGLFDSSSRRSFRNFRQRKVGFRPRAHDDRAVQLDQGRVRQGPAVSLDGQVFFEACSVEPIQRTLIVQVVGHRHGRAGKVATVLGDVGICNRQRRIDDRLGADLEPAIKADAKRYTGDNRDNDGRYCRHKRKHRDNAHMQFGSCSRLLTRKRNPPDFAPDQGDENENDEAVDRGHRQDGRGIRLNGVAPTRTANERAAVIKPPTIATMPGSASKRLPLAGAAAPANTGEVVDTVFEVILDGRITEEAITAFVAIVQQSGALRQQ